MKMGRRLTQPPCKSISGMTRIRETETRRFEKMLHTASERTEALTTLLHLLKNRLY
jgi:hypothetical protein